MKLQLTNLTPFRYAQLPLSTLWRGASSRGRNRFTNSSEYVIHIPHYFVVRDAQHSVTERFEAFLPNSIFIDGVLVNSTVNFDNQTVFETNKVDDELVNRVLTAEF